MQTKILVDGHVHLYPVYDYEKAIETGIDNLSTICSPQNCTFVFLLTERSDCNFYRDVTNGELTDNSNLVFSKNKQDQSLIVRLQKNEQQVYIIPGRQIVSSENLEVGALFTDYAVEDKRFSSEELVHNILGENGIPVLNWAPGKWFGKRGKLVEKLLTLYSPKQLWLGDTTMRTTLWPTPALMKKGIQKGFHVIAGSDPLPFRGEENMLGSYASLLQGPLDPERPAASLRALMLSTSRVERAGRRSPLFPFLRRQFRIMYNK